MTVKKVNTERRRVQFETTGESMTRQSHKKECDINVIVSRFNKDGVVTHIAKHGGSYGDVTGADYRTMMNQVVRAQEMFDELPSEVRKRFGNDPATFLDFVQDEKNLEELRKMGLAKGLRENPPPSSVLNPTTPPVTEAQQQPSPPTVGDGNESASDVSQASQTPPQSPQAT